MKLKDILSPTLKDFQRPQVPMIQVAYDSDLCREVVERGILTEEQMRRAAERYRLGRSRSGKTIYWMIDERGVCRDGHVGCYSHRAETWVSQMLKLRYPENAKYICPRHCLFGLHLVSRAQPDWKSGSHMPVAIIESERSAVILSELLPECLWLATCYPANFTIDRLEPLSGRTVRLFPRTDSCMETYVYWLELANMARRLYHLDISVSTLLEDNCSEEQKARGIDLVDFILDSG